MNVQVRELGHGRVGSLELGVWSFRIPDKEQISFTRRLEGRAIFPQMSGCELAGEVANLSTSAECGKENAKVIPPFPFYGCGN